MDLAIPETKAHDGFWRGVWQGYLAAFFWFVSIILIAIFVRFGGHDLIDVLRDSLRPPGQ